MTTALLEQLAGTGQAERDIVTELSSVVSGFGSLVDLAFQGRVATIVAAVVLLAVLGGLAWAAMYSAGVARRRIRLSTDQAIRVLPLTFWLVATQ